MIHMRFKILFLTVILSRNHSENMTHFWLPVISPFVTLVYFVSGLMFVKIGHRRVYQIDVFTGAFGFLYSGDKDGDSKGNYGIQDQRQALVWVKENIRSFGGNPDKVTLFGQSAGAQSTATHLYNGKANGLFQNAIIESSPFSIRYKTRTEALFLGDTIAELANCSGGDTACLRSKTAFEIANAEEASRKKVTSLNILEFFEPLGPWVDGDEVPMEPVDAAAKGLLLDVPFMIGTTSEETRIYVYEAWGKPMNFETYSAVLFATDPKKVLDMLKMYPPENINDCRDELVRLATDFIFTCSTRNVTMSAQRSGKSPKFAYEYNHAFSFPGWGKFTFCEHHVCHGSEIPILFHTAERGGYTMTDDEEMLSQQMIYYWTNFAYTSNPSTGPHSVNLEWPTYNSTSEKIMHLQTPNLEILTTYRQEYCAFWDKIGYDI